MSVCYLQFLMISVQYYKCYCTLLMGPLFSRHSVKCKAWDGSPRESPLFMCPAFGYRYIGYGGTDRREILHYGTYVSRMCLLFWGH